MALDEAVSKSYSVTAYSLNDNGHPPIFDPRGSQAGPHIQPVGDPEVIPGQEETYTQSLTDPGLPCSLCPAASVHASLQRTTPYIPEETGSRQHEAALPGTIFKASVALSASLRTRGSAEVRVMET